MVAIAQNGASVTEGVGTYHGLGLSGAGVVPVVGVASTRYLNQSMLAAATAPSPPLRGWTGSALLSSAYLLAWVLLAPLAMVVSVSAAATHGSDGMAQLFIVVFGLAFAAPGVVGLGVALRNRRHNRRILRGRPAAVELWSQGWHCRRCGQCFWPAPSVPGVPVHQAMGLAEFQRTVWSAGFAAAGR